MVISEITLSKFMPLDVGHKTYVSVTVSFVGSVFSMLDLDCDRFDLQHISHTECGTPDLIHTCKFQSKMSSNHNKWPVEIERKLYFQINITLSTFFLLCD